MSLFASITACSSCPARASIRHLVCPRPSIFTAKSRKFGTFSGCQQQAAVRMRIHAHAQPALRRNLGKFRAEVHPSRRRVLRACSCASSLRAGADAPASRAISRSGTWCARQVFFHRLAVHKLRSGPALRRAHDQHGPCRPIGSLHPRAPPSESPQCDQASCRRPPPPSDASIAGSSPSSVNGSYP